MKEVRFWEAEDGTQFDNEYDCEEHERYVRFVELLKFVPCYNDVFVRMTGEDEDFDESDIYYILIPDNPSIDFTIALVKLNKEFFYDQLPYNEAKLHNDLLYRDEDSDSWRVWSKDLSNLEILKNHFQLFGEGE